MRNFLGWDTAIGLTLKGLVTSPGGMVLEYTSSRRRRYVNPARFCLLSLALGFLLSRLLSIDPLDISGIKITASSGGEVAKVVTQVREFIGQHLDLLLFLALPIRAWLLPVLLRRSQRNLAECLVLVLYIGGVGYLIGAILTPLYDPVVRDRRLRMDHVRRLLTGLRRIVRSHRFFRPNLQEP